MAGGSKTVVAYLSDATYVGGAERYLHLLISGLDRGRFEPVAVISASTGVDKLENWLAAEHIRVHRFRFGSPFSAAEVWLLVRALRSIKPDILHLNLPGPFDSVYGTPAVFARFAGVHKVVSTEHLPMIPTFFKARILRGISGRFIEKIITVSDDNRRHLTGIHKVRPGKIEVVYNGVPDTGRVAPASLFENKGKRDQICVVLMAGALEERKDHMTMFRAMKHVPENVYLAVAGQGPMEKNYRAAVADMGISGRVEFLGQRDDMPAVMRGSDLLVLPSRIEATPYVILEAMASGIPVVASSVFGIPELVIDGKTGFLVPPGDIEGFGSAVTKISRDAELRKKMSRESRSRYESRFTLVRSVSDTMRIYDDLIKIYERGAVRG